MLIYKIFLSKDPQLTLPNLYFMMLLSLLLENNTHIATHLVWSPTKERSDFIKGVFRLETQIVGQFFLILASKNLAHYHNALIQDLFMLILISFHEVYVVLKINCIAAKDRFWFKFVVRNIKLFTKQYNRNICPWLTFCQVNIGYWYGRIKRANFYIPYLFL